MSWNDKCRKCDKTPVEGERYCEYHLTHRTCYHCKQELHVSEFQNITKFNTGRCKKCYDLTENHKKCITCKELKHKNEFDLNKKTCKKCVSKNNEKYRHPRKCRVCKQTKEVEQFDYLMRTCKECAQGRTSLISKRSNSDIHCRHCNDATQNKSRVCDKCKELKRCKKCKQMKKKYDFEERKNVCNDCVAKFVASEKERKKGYKVDVTCDECKKVFSLISRFTTGPKHYICENCKKLQKQYYDSLPGNYVKCVFCVHEFLFIPK